MVVNAASTQRFITPIGGVERGHSLRQRHTRLQGYPLLTARVWQHYSIAVEFRAKDVRQPLTLQYAYVTATTQLPLPVRLRSSFPLQNGDAISLAFNAQPLRALPKTLPWIGFNIV